MSHKRNDTASFPSLTANGIVQRQILVAAIGICKACSPVRPSKIEHHLSRNLPPRTSMMRAIKKKQIIVIIKQMTRGRL